MTDLATTHPQTAAAIIIALCGIVSWAFVKIWALLRANLELREAATQKETSSLAKAIKDLEATMHAALDRLTSMIDRVDKRQDSLMADVYARIVKTEVQVNELIGEHKVMSKLAGSCGKDAHEH